LGGTLIAGGAQAQAADQTHKGSGGFNTTGFYTHGTRLEYHFGWRCSAFHTMHLELQRHVYRPIGPDTWETDKMLVEHDGHEGERHNHHYISPGFNWGGGPALYRLAVRTSPQCHWELHFTY
jgi:hypothetical protein